MSYSRALALVLRSMKDVAPADRPGHRRLRLKLCLAAARHGPALAALSATPSPALSRILEERPQTVAGLLVWPYICAAWGVGERLRRIGAHYRIVDRLGAPLPFAADQRLVLADLSDLWPGLAVVLDQPPWFMREGGLTISLFVADFRAYSLAFSFTEAAGDGGIDCLIGALQGRQDDAAADLYRDLTKAAHGLRPRDLLIEIGRILCRHWQVRALFAVADDYRHHRHPLFGTKTQAMQDYDAIWRDRGGVCENAHFFRLALQSERRADEAIKPNKRSLYRRRYRFLDRLEDEIRANLPALAPQPCADRQETGC